MEPHMTETTAPTDTERAVAAADIRRQLEELKLEGVKEGWNAAMVGVLKVIDLMKLRLPEAADALEELAAEIRPNLHPEIVVEEDRVLILDHEEAPGH
jgi:hypothetical protein